MKKTFFLLILTLATSVAAFSQNNSGFNFGGRVGVTISDFTNSAGEVRTGVQSGAFVGYNISRFGLELGAYYSEQGSYNIIDGYNRYDYNLDYINFQLLAKLRVFNNFRIFAGPQASTLISSSFVTRDSYSATSYSTYINEFDLGITAGVGYTASFGLDISASYTQGLNNLFKYDRTGYNTTFCISVGWVF